MAAPRCPVRPCPSCSSNHRVYTYILYILLIYRDTFIYLFIYMYINIVNITWKWAHLDVQFVPVLLVLAIAEQVLGEGVLQGRQHHLRISSHKEIILSSHLKLPVSTFLDSTFCTFVGTPVFLRLWESEIQITIQNSNSIHGSKIQITHLEEVSQRHLGHHDDDQVLHTHITHTSKPKLEGKLSNKRAQALCDTAVFRQLKF